MTSADVIVEQARAKINLALHVIGRRGDGYHELDSIVAFADVGDRLTFERSSADSFAIAGPFGDGLGTGQDNIVIKARDLIRIRIDTGPVAITLEKNLPVASGIGGGSADAAATLRGLNKLAALPLPKSEMSKLALQLGADVPVCLEGKACRMRGIGEIIEPFHNALPPAIVLVNPLAALATKDVFGAMGLKRGQSFSGALDAGNQMTWRNDLLPPAVTLLPVISDMIALMQAHATLLTVRMSGSGATCFGLAASVAEARQCRDLIRRARPGWWVEAGLLGHTQVEGTAKSNVASGA